MRRSVAILLIYKTPKMFFQIFLCAAIARNQSCTRACRPKLTQISLSAFSPHHGCALIGVIPQLTAPKCYYRFINYSRLLKLSPLRLLCHLRCSVAAALKRSMFSVCLLRAASQPESSGTTELVSRFIRSGFGLAGLAGMNSEASAGSGTARLLPARSVPICSSFA